MSDIEARIEKLEREAGEGKGGPPWLVVVYDGQGEPSEAALEKAKAEYKAKHPDWAGRDFNVISVVSEEGKAATERIIAGEGT